MCLVASAIKTCEQEIRPIVKNENAKVALRKKIPAHPRGIQCFRSRSQNETESLEPAKPMGASKTASSGQSCQSRCRAISTASVRPAGSGRSRAGEGKGSSSVRGAAKQPGDKAQTIAGPTAQPNIVAASNTNPTENRKEPSILSRFRSWAARSGPATHRGKSRVQPPHPANQ